MREIVFDIETKNIFEDVGKNDPVLLDISVVSLHDSETGELTSYLEEDFPELWKKIEQADVLIGYNSNHFDIPLLNKYYPGDLFAFKSIDLMATIKDALGRRLSLNNVAGATLGQRKSADGLLATQWWKDGEVEKVIKYCEQDVLVTRKLYEHMRDNKKIKYRDGSDLRELEINTDSWNESGDHSLTYSLGF